MCKRSLSYVSSEKKLHHQNLQFITLKSNQSLRASKSTQSRGSCRGDDIKCQRGQFGIQVPRTEIIRLWQDVPQQWVLRPDAAVTTRDARSGRFT
ncbi:hypothetical protein EVAR_46126_1 [Eumeta japonica]|uniref:Uncharacterized protein n=1 Tax=Eumeta variegata TaxID=151549 RepID=A0A4C1XR14_EUMVA|nr:hypothetical protein EVAR_46126_1 [Eumeta japonica]